MSDAMEKKVTYESVTPDAASRPGNANGHGFNVMRSLYRAWPDAMYDDRTPVRTETGMKPLGQVTMADRIVSSNGKFAGISAIRRESGVKAYEVRLETGQRFVAGPDAVLFAFTDKDGINLTNVMTAGQCSEHQCLRKRLPMYYMRRPALLPETRRLPGAPESDAGFTAGFMACCETLYSAMNVHVMCRDDCPGLVADVAADEITAELGLPQGAVRVHRTGRDRAEKITFPATYGINDLKAVIEAAPFRSVEYRKAFMRGAVTACGRVMKNSYLLRPDERRKMQSVAAVARSLGYKASLERQGIGTLSVFTTDDLAPEALFRLDVRDMRHMPQLDRMRVEKVSYMGTRDMTCIAPETGTYDYVIHDGIVAHVTLAAYEWLEKYPVYPKSP